MCPTGQFDTSKNIFGRGELKERKRKKEKEKEKTYFIPLQTSCCQFKSIFCPPIYIERNQTNKNKKDAISHFFYLKRSQNSILSFRFRVFQRLSLGGRGLNDFSGEVERGDEMKRGKEKKRRERWYLGHSFLNMNQPLFGFFLLGYSK